MIAGDRELYRITANTFTKINGRPVNLAMLYRYHSLQYWFSLSNVRVQKLVDFAYGAPQIGRAPGVSANSTLETLLGVKYSLAKPKHTRKEPYKKVETVKFQKKKWKVYQNLDYMGMAYLRNEEKANRLWQETEATGQYQTYFEQVLKDRKERAHADILDLHYEGNSFSCSVKAAKGDEAVFAIPYHSNWQAFVDGKKTATSTRDMAFLAIPLEEGDHEICLKYVSGSFRAGIAAMFLSMCVIALSRILYFRRK